MHSIEPDAHGRGVGRPSICRLLLCLLLACGAVEGCGLFRELGVGGDDPFWVERRYTEVGTAAVLQLLQTAVRERYPPQSLDLNDGTFTTGWVYGAYAAVSHQALRQRLLAETEVENAVLTVRVRVQQETSPSAGRSASRTVDDWERTEDDPIEAERLMARLHVLLREIGKPVVPERASAE